MDLKVIRQFIEIVDNGGFGKAAEKIHISQPALSKSISQLEKELDLVLLERGKRGTPICQTSAGEVIYRHGQQLLEGYKSMLAEIESRRRLTMGELKLGLAPLGSAELFAPVIARFRSRYPQIEMQLLVRGGLQQTHALKRGDIELATGIIDFNKEFDGIHIRREPMVVALPRQHPLAVKKTINLAELANIPQILFEPEYALNQLVSEACLQVGFAPHDVTRVSHPDFGVALIAAGAGVMILPKLIAERHRVSGVISRPLDNANFSWQLSLFWRRQHTLSFAAKIMVDMVKQQLSNRRDNNDILK